MKNSVARSTRSTVAPASAMAVSTDEVLALLRSRMESEEPDVILEVFKAWAGKTLTVRLLAKLPGGAERWSIDHGSTMTHLRSRDYHRTQGREGFSFLLSYQTKNVTIDPEALTKHNPCYFEARVERNRLRTVVMGSALSVDCMACALTEVRVARAALVLAEEKLAELAAYGKPFSPDQYEWERLGGGLR